MPTHPPCEPPPPSTPTPSVRTSAPPSLVAAGRVIVLLTAALLLLPSSAIAADRRAALGAPDARTAAADHGHRTAAGLPRGEPRSRPRKPAPGLPVGTMSLRGASGHGRAAGHILVRFTDGLPAWQEESVAAGLGAPRLHRARFGRFSRVDVPQGESPESLVAPLPRPSVRGLGGDRPAAPRRRDRRHGRRLHPQRSVLLAPVAHAAHRRRRGAGAQPARRRQRDRRGARHRGRLRQRLLLPDPPRPRPRRHPLRRRLRLRGPRRRSRTTSAPPPTPTAPSRRRASATAPSSPR